MTERRFSARPSIAVTRMLEGLGGDDAATWMRDAPCAGQWWATDLPAHHARLSAERLYRDMAEGLAMCARCPFSGLDGACVARIDRGQFGHDGLAGGIIWRNGKPLRLRKSVAA